MEHDPPGLESENAELSTGPGANPYAILRAKYDRLVGIMLTVQNLLDGLAGALERMQVRCAALCCASLCFDLACVCDVL